MRIAWGVHGYGRGHAMRVQALAGGLGARHELRFFAGGQAAGLDLGGGAAVPLPCLAYAYRGGQLSWAATLAANAVRIAAGHASTATLGAMFGPVQVERAGA